MWATNPDFVTDTEKFVMENTIKLPDPQIERRTSWSEDALVTNTRRTRQSWITPAHNIPELFLSSHLKLLNYGEVSFTRYLNPWSLTNKFYLFRSLIIITSQPLYHHWFPFNFDCQLHQNTLSRREWINQLGGWLSGLRLTDPSVPVVSINNWICLSVVSFRFCIGYSHFGHLRLYRPVSTKTSCRHRCIRSFHTLIVRLDGNSTSSFWPHQPVTNPDSVTATEHSLIEKNL